MVGGDQEMGYSGGGGYRQAGLPSRLLPLCSSHPLVPSTPPSRPCLRPPINFLLGIVRVESRRLDMGVFQGVCRRLRCACAIYVCVCQLHQVSLSFVHHSLHVRLDFLTARWPPRPFFVSRSHRVRSCGCEYCR